MMGKYEYRLREGHAYTCLGRTDTRLSQECNLPLFQYSSIPIFLVLPLIYPFQWTTERRA
jgi:hypothetical protein